jgi:hypothetical protein
MALDQQRQLLGMIGVVGVDEHHDRGRTAVAQVGERGEAGAAVPSAGGEHHLGAAGARHLAGAVARVVVGHHYPSGRGRAQRRQHQGKRRLFVVGRDDHVDRVGRRSRHAARS